MNEMPSKTDATVGEECPMGCGGYLLRRVNESGTRLISCTNCAYTAVLPKTDPSLSTCPQCNARMILRHSRYGAFLSCSKFPRCRGTRVVRGAQHRPH